MRKALTIILLSCFVTGNLFAQIQRKNSVPPPAKSPQEKQIRKQKAGNERPTVYTGLGLGLDYGGIGFKAEYLPVSFLGVFAGAGYNLAGIGVNGGLSFKLTPNTRFRPVATIMYGYNAVLIVKDQFDRFVSRKTYYGFTPGIGCEIDVSKRRTNKISVQILIPFRSAEFNADISKTDATVPPFTISMGINLGY